MNNLDGDQQKTWQAWQAASTAPTKNNNNNNDDSLFSTAAAGGNNSLQHQQGIALPMSIPHSQAQAVGMNGFHNEMNDNSTSASLQPMNQIAVSNIAPQYSTDKQGTSNTPPSPADSGVLSDSKSDSGAVPNEQMFAGVVDQQQQQQHVSSYDEQRSKQVFNSQQNTTYSHANGNDLFQSNLMEDLDKQHREQLQQQKDLLFSNSEPLFSNNNTGGGGDHLSQIWSPQQSHAMSNFDTDQMTNNQMSQYINLLQQQKQQQQQRELQRMTSNGCPPGLADRNSIERSWAKMQAHDRKAQLFQAQNMMSGNGLPRSTSFQPVHNTFGGFNQSGMDNFDMSALDRALPNDYSNWNGNGNNGFSRFANMLSSINNNSAQHQFNASQQQQQALHGHSGLQRSSYNNGQFGATPRLSRSISTPANYSGIGNGFCNLPNLTSSMDDNPFYKSSVDQMPTRSLSTMASEHTASDRVDFQYFYDLLRADNLQQRRVNPNSTPPWNALLNENNIQHPSLYFNEQQQYSNNTGDVNYNSYASFAARFRYSRKVFVGGLPPDIDEDQIKQSFCKFGQLTVDWPHKNESKSFFPPKGYAFLIFQEDLSVWNLISYCSKEADKLFYRVSSPTVSDKQVQIRPWKISDADFSFGSSETLDGRKTIFVGGVPRPLRAVELALIMERLYGGVCYAGIDVDQDLKYPKGAGRVAFNTQRSYIAAISARYVQLKEGEINKRVEVKPYVVDDQLCDECQGTQSNRKFAPYFCANVTCLKYYCESCWNKQHSVMGRELHKPLTKDGSSERAPKSVRSSNW